MRTSSIPTVTSGRKSRVRRPSTRLLTVLALFALVVVRPWSRPLSASEEASRDGGPLVPELEWSWSLLGDGIGSAGLLTADLDQDGDIEIVTANDGPDYFFDAGDYWFEISYDGIARQTWSSLAFADRIVRLRPVEIGGDIDIAIATETDVLVFDGGSKQLVRAISEVATELRDFFVLDIDSDSNLELLLCDAGDLAILDFDTLNPEGSLEDVPCAALDVAQADGDSQLEILVIGPVDGLVLDGVSLTPDWFEADAGGAPARFLDLDLDGVAELLGRNPPSDTLRAIDLPSGNLIWSSGRPMSSIEALSRSLVIEPGGPRVLLGSSSSFGSLIALDAATGSFVWSVAVDSRDFRGLMTSDVDKDGVAEALFGAGRGLDSGERLMVVDLEALTIEHETARYGGPLVGVDVGDADAAGAPELVTASQRSQPPPDTGRLLVLDPETRALEFEQGEPAMAPFVLLSALAAPLDEDPQLELCTAGEYGVACIDGLTHEEEWTIEFPWGTAASALASTDIDGDGRDELLVGSESGLVYAFDGATGWLRWRSAPTGFLSNVAQLRVGDVLGGPREEIIVTAHFHSGCYVAVLESSTGRFLWWPVVFGTWHSLGLAQIDNDPQLDLLLGSNSGDVAVLDLETRSLGPPLLTVDEWVFGIAAADLGGDPRLEIVVRDASGIHLFGGDPLVELWESPYLGPVGSNEPLVVANIDRDFGLELLAASWSSIASFEFPFPGLFADGFESGDTTAWSASAPLDTR